MRHPEKTDPQTSFQLNLEQLELNNIPPDAERGDDVTDAKGAVMGQLVRMQMWERQILEAPLCAVFPRYDQPRADFEDKEEGHEEQHNPIMVVPFHDVRNNRIAFLIVDGEMRYRRAMRKNAQTISVQVIWNPSLAALLAMATVINVDRKPLNPMEEAVVFKQIIDGMVSGKQAENETEAVRLWAERLHKSPNHIYNRLALLRLHPDLQKLVREGRLNLSHALKMCTAEMLAPARQQVLAAMLTASARRAKQDAFLSPGVVEDALRRAAVAGGVAEAAGEKADARAVQDQLAEFRGQLNVVLKSAGLLLKKIADGNLAVAKILQDDRRKEALGQAVLSTHNRLTEVLEVLWPRQQ